MPLFLLLFFFFGFILFQNECVLMSSSSYTSYCHLTSYITHTVVDILQIPQRVSLLFILTFKIFFTCLRFSLLSFHFFSFFFYVKKKKFQFFFSKVEGECLCMYVYVKELISRILMIFVKKWLIIDCEVISSEKVIC